MLASGLAYKMTSSLLYSIYPIGLGLVGDFFLFLSHKLSNSDPCLFMSSHVLYVSALDSGHYIDFQWTGKRHVIKSQVALTVLVNFYKNKRQDANGSNHFTCTEFEPPLILNWTSSSCHFCAFWPQTKGIHFFMSHWSSNRPLILQHLLGVVLSKLYSSGLRHSALKYILYFHRINKNLHTVH